MYHRKHLTLHIVGQVLLLALIGLALSYIPARAEWNTTPLTNWKDHAFVVSNVGWLTFKPYGSEVAPWNGPDIALGAGYNAGPITGAAIFEHGFPVKAADGHRNVGRAFLNLKLYPNGPGGQWQTFAGAGVLAMGTRTARDWTGGEAHLTVTRSLSQRMAAGAYYGHAFGGSGNGDFDFLRVYLTGRLYP